MINTFDTDKNFWQEHPDMKVITPFKQIFEDDRSKKKETSSMLMWFIVLCYDRDSKLFKLPLKDKYAIAGEDYCGDVEYYSKNNILIDMCIEQYIELQYTPMQRQMMTLERLLAKRAKYLEEAEYDLETGEKLDKIVTGTYKVWQDYKKIVEEMEKEMQGGMAKGGATPSLLDG